MSIDQTASGSKPARRLVAAAVTAALALGLGTALVLRSAPGVHAAADAASPLPAVIFVPAHRGKNLGELTLPATLIPLREATLHARASGYVRRWNVEMGDRVRQGQVLAEIEVPELDRELDEGRANLQRVKAELDLARSTARRYRSLLAEQAVSEQEVDERTGALSAREAEHNSLRARVRQLESLRAFQNVVAPFPGTVTARNVEIGSLVTAGSSATWLFKLAQSDSLRVLVSVPQGNLGVIKPGTQAEITVRELGGEPLTATVVRNAGAFDAATRTIVTELRVPNPDGKILPGMYGQVKFHVPHAEAPLVVPVNALLVGGDGPRVAIVDAGDVVRIRKVKLGRDLGKQMEILDGLAENDRVIANPRDNLEDGGKVKPIPAPKHDDKKEKEKAASAEPPRKDAAAPK